MAAITASSVILMASGVRWYQSGSPLSESGDSLAWFVPLEAVKQEGLDLLWAASQLSLGEKLCAVVTSADAVALLVFMVENFSMSVNKTNKPTSETSHPHKNLEPAIKSSRSLCDALYWIQ